MRKISSHSFLSHTTTEEPGYEKKKKVSFVTRHLSQCLSQTCAFMNQFHVVWGFEDCLKCFTGCDELSASYDAISDASVLAICSPCETASKSKPTNHASSSMSSLSTALIGRSQLQLV